MYTIIICDINGYSISHSDFKRAYETFDKACENTDVEVAAIYSPSGEFVNSYAKHAK